MIYTKAILACDFPFCLARFEPDFATKVAAVLDEAKNRGWDTINGMHVCGPADKEPNPPEYATGDLRWSNHAVAARESPHQPELRHIGRARYMTGCLCGWEEDDQYSRSFGRSRVNALESWRRHLYDVVKADRDSRAHG